MRALPGRESRASQGDSPTTVTRDTVKEDQRRRIRVATAELVAKRGYNAVTVELIVKRARVSYKTFYQHFSNKEECFLEFFDTYVDEAGDRVGSALADEKDAAWPQQVVVALRALFGMFVADPLLARAIVVEAQTVGPAIFDRYEKATRALSPLLHGGRELSPHRDELPDALEDTLAGGMIWSAYQRLIVGETDRIEALLPESIEFVLRPYIGNEEAARWSQWSQDHAVEPVALAL